MLTAIAISNRQTPNEDQYPRFTGNPGAAEFSEPQARTLVEILQAARGVEREPESELERIEQYLLAEPFQPFVIEMSTGASYRIQRRGQCGFDRHGWVRLSQVDAVPRTILGSDHIIRVRKI